MTGLEPVPSQNQKKIEKEKGRKWAGNSFGGIGFLISTEIGFLVISTPHLEAYYSGYLETKNEAESGGRVCPKSMLRRYVPSPTPSTARQARKDSEYFGVRGRATK